MNTFKIAILISGVIIILFTVIYTFKKQRKKALELQKKRDRRFADSLQNYKKD